MALTVGVRFLFSLCLREISVSLWLVSFVEIFTTETQSTHKDTEKGAEFGHCIVSCRTRLAARRLFLYRTGSSFRAFPLIVQFRQSRLGLFVRFVGRHEFGDVTRDLRLGHLVRDFRYLLFEFRDFSFDGLCVARFFDYLDALGSIS